MTFLEFQKTFSDTPVIPLTSIKMHFPNFDSNALTRWQKKGYLEKFRNEYYHLTDHKITGNADLFFIANKIYHPSYISLYSALNWYGFIPEGVFEITSISTRKTKTFQTPQAVFSYKSIRKNLFFGYQLEKINNYWYKIANPTKAILDFLYLYSSFNSADDFHELRINSYLMKQKMEWDLAEVYLRYFNSKALTKRVSILKKYLDGC